MRKTVSSSLIFSVLVFALPFSSVAIDRTTSARILDTFKEWQKEILFENTPVHGSENILLEHEYTMNGLEALKSKLEAIKSISNQEKEVISYKRQTLESTISAIQNAIDVTEWNIRQIETDIQSRSEKIQELQSISLSYRKKIREHRVIILKYLSNIYTESSYISDDLGEIDIMKSLILTDKDTDYFFTDLVYKELVTLLGQKFVDEYKWLVKDYYVLSTDLDREIISLEETKKNLAFQKETIEKQKEAQAKLLEVTKWREAVFEKYIQSQNEAVQIIESAWQKENEKYEWVLSGILAKSGCTETDVYGGAESLSPTCQEMKKYFQLERALRSQTFWTGTANILAWPVQDKRISTYFRDPSYYSILWSQHDAIDIAIEQGSDVYASAGGYVSYILPPTPGGYSYLAIRHPDGFVTVYGHLSEIFVSQYQWVTAGQVIAKSGWAPWTPGAGPMTSGAHLHFEVWKDKAPVDPLRYLSIADLNFTTLPSLYEEKFISDFVEKTGTGTNTDWIQRKFVLKWENETERQKYLLKTYAAPDFQSWDMWVDSALSARIDPSFLMCVGLAETTLW
jgi:murein DD-endopeptidase MepM/ murein hydrolase activator NlpD